MADSAEGRAFWNQTKFIDVVFGIVESTRTWGSGCECHDDDRQDGKPVQCRLTGRRLREAFGKFQEMMDLLRVLRDFAITLHPWIYDVGMGAELNRSIDCLRGVASVKFAFLDKVPYTIVRCRQRMVAATFLERCDALVAAGEQLHRVAARFVHPLSRLRRPFEEWVQQGTMSDTLSLELAKYEWGRLDETPIEAAHRDVNHEVSRARGSKHAFASATIRRQSTIDLVGQVQSAGKAQKAAFLKCWSRWKLLGGKPSPNDSRLAIPRGSELLAMRGSAVLQRAYRVGSSSLEDWSALRPLFGEVPYPKVEVSDVQAMLGDYLDKSMQVGSVYSLPHDEADNWEALVCAAEPGQALHGVAFNIVGAELEARHLNQRFFHVLDKQPRRKKVVRTDEDLATGVCSWLVAPLSRWGQGGSAIRELFEEEPPKVQDIAGFEPWPCWRYALRQWSYQGPSDVYGCTSYDGGALVSWEAAELLDLPLPITLERLAALGWRTGRLANKPHSAAADQLLDLSRGFAKRPAYFSCLLELQRLFDEGLQPLHCKQHDAYYRCALQITDKGFLQIGWKVKQYERLIELSRNGEPLQLLDEPALKRRRVALGDEPVGAPMLVDGLVFAPLQLEVGPGDANAHSDEDGASASPVGVFDDFVEEEGSADDEEGPVGVLEVPAVPVMPVPDWWNSELARIRAAAVPNSFGGQPITLDYCFNASSGRRYIRKLIHCTKHLQCFKNRNTNFDQHHGQLEVVGYLGCWLAAKDDPRHGGDRVSHMSYRPKVPDVTAFLDERGLL